MSEDDVRARWILHFTHLDNVPSIVAAGALACDWQARQGSMVAEVGDPSIKEARRRRAVPVPPGGTVGDYVPFYFAPRSPMMFRIACDCRDAIPAGTRVAIGPSCTSRREWPRWSSPGCPGL